jgi:lycopene beta-cyclase
MAIQSFSRLDRRFIGAFGLWMLIMVGTPIVRWLAGQSGLMIMVNLGVLAQVFVVLVAFAVSSGWKTVPRLLIILPIAWLAEYIGSHTGFPFGRYSYTVLLQPQLGSVPILIPLAWSMMLPPAWAVADGIMDGKGRRLAAWQLRLMRACVAGLAFTAWDLFIDPQMIQWGFWHWSSPGFYFGVPLTNFLGWLLVSILASFFLMPQNLDAKPLVLIYAGMWFLQSFGDLFFWHLPGPAIVGFLVMGGMLAWMAVNRK